MKKYALIVSTSVLALILLFAYQTTRFSDKTLHVIFCDVGQGDGVLVRTPSGADVVIDGGQQNGKMLKCLAEHMPFWDHDIELVFATHPDADHIGGLVEVLKTYKVLSFATSEATKSTDVFKALSDQISSQKIPFREIYSGDKFSLSDGISFETLSPPRGFVSSDSNEYSLVQIVSYGAFRALLTGDATSRILDSIVSRDSFQILKLAHHGSKTGTDDKTFKNIHPNLAIISVGRNNRYHHPSPQVLELLSKFKLRYMRTDQSGSIEVVTDGKNTKVLD